MSSRPAYSLVYALIYMVVILLVATTALENVEGKRLHMLDVEHTAQARITARSSSESAYIAAKNAELGYETSGARFWWMGGAPGEWDTELDATETGYERCIPENLLKVGDGCGKWKVMARAQKNKFDSTDSKLYTPIPNTGDAWDPDVCIKHFEVPRDADHPCNWNKIRYGEAVSIPLYYTDPVSGDTVTPFQDGSYHWYLRLRTPCKPDDDGHPVAECDNDDSWDFDPGSLFTGIVQQGLSTLHPLYYDPEEDQSLILWSLVGDREDGSQETFFVNPETIDMRTDLIEKQPGRSEFDTSLNTEITESLMNGQKLSPVGSLENVVLTSEDVGQFSWAGYDSVRNFIADPSLVKISLRVEVANPLRSREGGSIPDLEWQLVSDLPLDQALASDKALLTGFGYEKGHKGVYSYPFRKTWDRIREIIPNFTIAN